MELTNATKRWCTNATTFNTNVANAMGWEVYPLNM